MGCKSFVWLEFVFKMFKTNVKGETKEKNRLSVPGQEHTIKGEKRIDTANVTSSAYLNIGNKAKRKLQLGRCVIQGRVL